MKHLIFIICALLGCINITKAQVVISTSDLSGTKWQSVRQYDDQSKEYYEYTQSVDIWHQDDDSTVESPYYLSNTKVTKFDYTKVGKNAQGYYLIEINPHWNLLHCYLIRYFNKTEGKMVLEDMEDGRKLTYILLPSNKPRNQSTNEMPSEHW